jgi:hypothetical protein
VWSGSIAPPTAPLIRSAPAATWSAGTAETPPESLPPTLGSEAYQQLTAALARAGPSTSDHT